MGRTNYALQTLKSKLEGYPKFDKWIKSEYCTLNANEIASILSFLKHGSYKPFQRKNKLADTRVKSIYYGALKKLDLARTKNNYLRWSAIDQLVEEGIISRKDIGNYMSRLNPVQVLRIPIDAFIRAHKTAPMYEGLLAYTEHIEDYKGLPKNERKEMDLHSLQVILLLCYDDP